MPRFGANVAGNSDPPRFAACRVLRPLTERDEMVPIRDQIARLVYTGLEEMEARRTVVVVAHIVLARPQHLDRNADLSRDPGGFDRVVVRQAPAEAAATFHDVPGDVALLDAERGHHRARGPPPAAGLAPISRVSRSRNGRRCSRGSSGAWERNGYEYAASTTFAADWSAMSTLPSVRSVLAGVCCRQLARALRKPGAALLRGRPLRPTAPAASAARCAPATRNRRRWRRRYEAGQDRRALNDESVADAGHRLDRVQVRARSPCRRTPGTSRTPRTACSGR